MQKGHTFTPPTLSRHIGSAGYKQRAVGAFFNNISQLIQVIGMLFLVIDPDCYLRYWRLFQEDCSNNVPCSLLNTSRRACYYGLALLRNTQVEAHKNYNDTPDGWVAMCCWGNFPGES
ncbi:hypothetical protein BDZ91DRAFT_562754 [Kalaharituber pfeilii]|nr:hypothetical protein BDZ91DRAFT_562754 [Kalaharituber pfeilii]